MNARVELRRYTNKRSDNGSLLVVVAHIAFVFAPVYLTVVFGLGWHLLVFWLWFGLAMNGLLNLMHEASHYHVFKARRGSDVLGRWILGPMAMADFDAYRDRHWNHHRRLGEPDDPKTTYHSDIHGWRIAGYLLRCLLLFEAMQRFRSQTDAAGDEYDPPILSRIWMARVLGGQAVLGGSLLALSWVLHGENPGRALLIAAVAYAGVYGYGLASVTVFAAGMRAIAEHQLSEDDEAVRVGSAALRNFTTNPVSWLVLGSYGFAEHATHHREPAIPYYRLPAATTELAQVEPALAPRSGYLATLRALVRGSGEQPAIEAVD